VVVFAVVRVGGVGGVGGVVYAGGAGVRVICVGIYVGTGVVVVVDYCVVSVCADEIDCVTVVADVGVVIRVLLHMVPVFCRCCWC